MVEKELQRIPEAQGWVLEDKEKFSRWISSWEKVVCSKGISMWGTRSSLRLLDCEE